MDVGWRDISRKARRNSRREFLSAGARNVVAIVASGLIQGVKGAAEGAPSIPSADDVIFKSASEMARLVRAGSISSEELVRAHLRQIRKVNGALNAVCLLDEEGALKGARVADAALARGDQVGVLHGVPITIKDSFDTKGIVSTGGTMGRKGHVPEKDATAVARLRGAGAIIIGKTNTPELTLSHETENLIYGRTNNPYDLARTSGGSSGGAAAILTVGGAALDLGSDTAGSIRIPAHFCGVAGLKPTFGRVSRAGHIIPPGGVIGRQTHVGPMARFVEDLALALSVISGIDPEDPDVVPVEQVAHSKVDFKSLRAAYFFDHKNATAAAPVRQTVQATIDALSSDGIQCEQACPDLFEAAHDIASSLNSGDGGDYYRHLLRRHGTTNPHPATVNFLNRARNGVISGRKYSDVLLAWGTLREAGIKFMANFDVLICPPCTGVAPKHHESGSLDYSNAFLFNLLGWPAVVVRAGRTAEGLPVGIQIVGRPWREDQVLALAIAVERKLGGWKRDFSELPLHGPRPA